MKIALYILIISLAVCTFLTSDKTIDYTLTIRHLVWIATTIVLFLIVSVKILRNPKSVDLGFFRLYIFPVFCGFLVVSAISLFHARNLGEGIYEVLKLFMMIIYLFLAIVILRQRDVFIKSLVVIGLVLSVYGFYLYFADPSVMDRRGTMANKNLFSSAMMLLSPFCIYAFSKYGRNWKILSALVLVLIIFNIFTLKARSVILATFVMVAVVGINNRKNLIRAFVFFVFAGSVLWYMNGKNLFNTASLRQRYNLWSQTAYMIKDNPFGVGANNWRLSIPAYSRNMTDEMREKAFKKVYYVRNHNDPIQVWAETSFVGLIFYMSFFGLALYYSYKSGNRYIMAGIVGYMWFSCWSFPRERPYHSMIIEILVALSVLGYLKYKKCQPYFVTKRIAFVSSLLIGTLLSITFVDFALRYETEKFVLRIIRAKAKKDWQSVLQETQRATWVSTIDPTTTPIAYHSGIAHYFLKDYKKALESFEKAVEVHPNHIYVLMNLASMYLVQGRTMESQECYRRVKELYPDFKGAEKSLSVVDSIIKKGIRIVPPT